MTRFNKSRREVDHVHFKVCSYVSYARKERRNCEAVLRA